ncbi:hypothetical protein XA68_18460 [Ophiocordyceps unilateralis]|uniref:Uncharacterized protein n=1 Tax=Ophiocordyceps unilateralis TaxID=268505 RepID=A0A2A9PJB3_OPHUN|nr:hypothetical protein XA68_18460 [Ophiocordyceps unilateralis]
MLPDEDAASQGTAIRRFSAAETSQSTSKAGASTVRSSSSSWYNSTRRWLGRAVGSLSRRERRATQSTSRRKSSRRLFGRRRRASAGSLGAALRAVTPTTTIVARGGFKPAKSQFHGPANSQFPGGEAVRVSTPPLDEDTADGKPRGFFTCTTPPSPSGRPMSPMPPSPSLRRGSVSASTREWWEAPPLRSTRLPTVTAAGFQFEIPEHLPSSPLCPANSRYRPRGRGVCVYHGRRKGSTLRRGSSQDLGQGSEAD